MEAAQVDAHSRPRGDVQVESAALRECHELVIERVAQAVQESESAVFVAGDRVDQIVTTAERQVADLEQLLEALDGSRDAPQGVVGLIAQQDRTTQEFVGCMVDGLRRQNEAATGAASLTEDISRFAREIARISTEARLLTVNVRIEAAHLGENGRTVAVIATQIHDVSRAIEVANRTITDLATSLARLLPKIADRSTQMRSEADRFANALSEQAASMSDGVTTLQVMMSQAIHESRHRNEQVVRMAREALSSLQFQDPMSQELRDLVLVIEEIAARYDIDCGPSAGVLRTMGRDLPTASDDDVPEHGDVMLF